MVARGRVQNGVVVLDDGVRLPEGQEVTVLAHGTPSPAPRMEGSRSRGVLDIATVSVGSVLRPLTSDDDLLGEMLEGRPCSWAASDCWIRSLPQLTARLASNRSSPPTSRTSWFSVSLRASRLGEAARIPECVGSRHRAVARTRGEQGSRVPGSASAHITHGND
jgi:hypothetical protein